MSMRKHRTGLRSTPVTVNSPSWEPSRSSRPYVSDLGGRRIRFSTLCHELMAIASPILHEGLRGGAG